MAAGKSSEVSAEDLCEYRAPSTHLEMRVLTNAEEIAERIEICPTKNPQGRMIYLLQLLHQLLKKWHMFWLFFLT